MTSRAKTLEERVLELEKKIDAMSESLSRMELTACVNAAQVPSFCSTVKGYDMYEGKGNKCVFCGKIVQHGEEVKWAYIAGKTYDKGTITNPKMTTTSRPVHKECLTDSWRENFSDW